MSFGLRIKNANGVVVIDGTYSNMGMRQKGQVYANQGQYTNGAYYVDLVVAGGSPVLALASAEFCALVGTSKSGSSTTFRIISVSNSVVINYYIFDEASLATLYPTNFGLRVKNPNTGAVVYDSRAPYMRITGVLQANASNGSPSGTTNYNSSFLAVIQNTTTSTILDVMFPGGSPPMRQTGKSMGGFKVQGNSVTLGDMLIYMYPPATNNPIPLDADKTFYSYLVLDVSNF